jgi:TolB-like protein
MASELEAGGPETPARLCFAGFTLDGGGYTLTDASGCDVPLRRAEFALLLAFVRAPGRVLSRDYLLDAVSGRQSAPYDRSVDVLVSRLRRRIEADPELPRLIVTVPGLGYKFAARPQARGACSDGGGARMVIAAAVPDSPAIAVLPFQNISDDPGQECFANGVTEEIITALARLASFRMIAGPCSKPADIREMGRKLQVQYVLEGSVRKAGQRVRICGRLIDTTSGAHVWAERFDCALGDSLDLQEEVAGWVVGAIHAKFRGIEWELELRKPADAMEAKDFVASSRFVQSGSFRETVLESRRLLERAVEIDPKYPLALALLARCNWLMTNQLLHLPSDSELAGYIRMAWDAVERGRDDPEVLVPAAHIIAAASDTEQGITLLDRALGLNLHSAGGLALSGIIRAYAGDTEIALSHLERSIRLNPLDGGLSPQALGSVVAYTVAGRYEDALIWRDKALRDRPNDYLSLHSRAALLGLLGRTDEAQQVLRRLLRLAPELTVSRVRHHIEVVMRAPPLIKKGGFPRTIYEGLRMAGLPE